MSFEQYKVQFGRTYAAGTEEHQVRQNLFYENQAEILSHNALGKSWKMGINHLTDLTAGEMKMRLGYKPRRKFASASVLQLREEKSCLTQSQSCIEKSSVCCSDLACNIQGECVKAVHKDSQDWSEASPTRLEVLDQGACGSCWAVAAAAVLQMQAEIVSGYRINKVISPQSLLTCTPNEMSCGGEGGCKGATAELAFEWLSSQGERGGVKPIDQQKYLAADGDKSSCPASSGTSFLSKKPAPTLTIKGFRTVEPNNANALMETLVHSGPAVTSIVGAGLRGYSSGVLDGCDNFIIDHAVVMVGYGNDQDLGMKYWKIRNSWGKEWGENGYFRLQRFAPDSKEPCGWNTDPSKGVACKNESGLYPEKQYMCGACGILSDTAYPIGTQVPESWLQAQ
jgi:cathepsin L